MNFDTEKRMWLAEVDDKAAKLVRNGMTPDNAMKQAIKIVCMERSGILPNDERLSD